MEAIFGIVGKDFVLVAADNLVARSIMVMKAGEDKSRNLNSHATLVYTGEPGDASQFAEFVQRNVQLAGIRTDLPMTPRACAHFARSELAAALRSRNPYSVNMLIAGFGKDGPELYWIDYFAALNKLPYAAHGYASFFTMSLMDRYCTKDMSLQEATDVMRKCFIELKTRFIVNLPKFVVKVVDKDGIREIPIDF